MKRPAQLVRTPRARTLHGAVKRTLELRGFLIPYPAYEPTDRDDSNLAWRLHDTVKYLGHGTTLSYEQPQGRWFSSPIRIHFHPDVKAYFDRYGEKYVIALEAAFRLTNQTYGQSE